MSADHDEEKGRFLAPVDEDAENGENDGINGDTDEFEHTDIMRAAYDDLLEVGLLLHVVRQGGDDDPDVLAEPESAELRFARSNPPLCNNQWQHCFLLHKASDLQWNGLRRAIYWPLV